MFLTNSTSEFIHAATEESFVQSHSRILLDIKEVLFFPAMKPDRLITSGPATTSTGGPQLVQSGQV
jgi:hypothetical protein